MWCEAVRQLRDVSFTRNSKLCGLVLPNKKILEKWVDTAGAQLCTEIWRWIMFFFFFFFTLCSDWFLFLCICGLQQIEQSFGNKILHVAFWLVTLHMQQATCSFVVATHHTLRYRAKTIQLCQISPICDPSRPKHSEDATHSRNISSEPSRKSGPADRNEILPCDPGPSLLLFSWKVFESFYLLSKVSRLLWETPSFQDVKWSLNLSDFVAICVKV